MIPVILTISICIFIIIKLTPGEPVGNQLNPKSTAEERAAERIRLGLDKPIHIQYLDWLGRTLRGDFGQSYIYKRPVKDIVGHFVVNSFILNLGVFFLTFLISIPIGIVCAKKQYSKTDNFFSVFSLVGISMPSFFFGLLLIFALAVHFKIFPINGMINAGSETQGFERVKEVLHHMVLPGIVLTIGSLASLVRYVRNGMLDVLHKDYIRTARAKGLSERKVVYKHGFRNALITIVTVLGFWLPGLFSGAVILESIFVWPGIGSTLVDAVNGRDYNLMMAIMLLFAILTLIGNLLADIGYALVDPRVKVGEGNS